MKLLRVQHLLGLSSKLDSTRADTSVDEAVAATDIGTTVIGSIANVVVTLEEHIIELDHLCQNVCFLLRGDVLGSEFDIEQIAIGEQFTNTLSQSCWFELGDGCKVSKVGSVELGRVVGHIGADSTHGKDGFSAHCSQSAGTAWSLDGRKESSLGLRVVWVGALHHLHNGLESTTTWGLNDFSKQLCSIPVSRSRFSGAIAGVKCSSIPTFLATSKATNARLGAFSGAAEITTIALVGHEWGATLGGIVGPIDFLPWLEFGGIFPDVVKLGMERIGRLATASGQSIRFLFDNLLRY